MVATKMTFAVLLSLMFAISLIIIYFNKQHIANEENKIYKSLIISNAIGLILHIICDFVSYNYDTVPVFISTIFLKSLLIYYFLFGIFLLVYLIVISDFKNKNIYYKILKCVGILSIAAIIILPQNLVINKTNMIFYTNGLDTKFVFLISGALITAMSSIVLFRFKHLEKKKIIPLIVFLIFVVASTAIQRKYPDIVFTDCIETVVILLMYFTIENPDLAMIEQLNIAKDQADKANEAKSDFLSNMSHEIRTPLNAIIGFSQALQEEELPASAKEEVDDIMMASQGLLEIVNGILDISKIESGKIEIVNKEYSFKEVFDDLVILTKSRMGDKPLEFKTSYDDSIPHVLYGDNTRVKQVILNILTNAVKYTKEGYIDFRVSSIVRDDICRLIISVEDSGIGIKEENIDKLFSKFQRLDLDKNITIEGTGLGLAITKKLVDIMGGKIVVQSIYGKGSKFTIAIDQRVIHKEITEAAPVEDKININANTDFTGKNILIVDDNKINLKVASRLLQNYKANTITVDSGVECLEKIKAGEKYDLILLDDMMPKMSGVETLTNLKQIEGFNIPTVALTANAIEGMKEKYLASGFDDYLAKPIDKLELNKIIVKYLNK